MNIKPIKNNILFTFINNISKHEGYRIFSETRASGIIVESYDESTKLDQWGIVLEVGPDVSPLIKKGTKILIENLKWTEECTINKFSFWRTTDDHVLIFEDNDNGIKVGI